VDRSRRRKGREHPSLRGFPFPLHTLGLALLAAVSVATYPGFFGSERLRKFCGSPD
jgi:hypothetical protein